MSFIFGIEPLGDRKLSFTFFARAFRFRSLTSFDNTWSEPTTHRYKTEQHWMEKEKHYPVWLHLKLAYASASQTRKVPVRALRVRRMPRSQFAVPSEETFELWLWQFFRSLLNRFSYTLEKATILVWCENCAVPHRR